MNILSLSNYIPEQICDTVRFRSYSEQFAISHFCGYASEFIAKAVKDSSIDGAVYPRSCDSSRIISSYVENTDKFLYQFHIPCTCGSMAAEQLAENIRSYKKAIEDHYAVSIDNVEERAAKVETRNAAMREVYANIADCSYYDYICRVHSMLDMPLAEQETVVPETRPAGGKPVFIIGSTLVNTDIIKVIENSGLRIVGDRLPESRRLFFRKKVGISGDIYRSVAESILSGMQSPSQNNFKSIISEDTEEIKNKSVKGVIFITQKYCEPYDYLFLSYKRVLEETNIPILKIVLSADGSANNASLLTEAFADTI